MTIVSIPANVLRPVRVATLLSLLLLASAHSSYGQTLSERLKSEPVATLAAAAREKGDAVRGAILYTQQNLACTRCHTAVAGKAVGPDLMQLKNDVADTDLVYALLEPSKTIAKGFESVTVVTTEGKVFPGRILEDQTDKIVMQVSSGDLPRVTLLQSEIEKIAPSQVSAMPENLVDQLASRDQFLDLVRYLMELAAADKTRLAHINPTGGKSLPQELQGVVLLKEFRCAACHVDDLATVTLTDKPAPNLVRSVGRINPHFLRKFLADPLSVKHGTTMPDMMSGLTDEERRTAADELTHYLVSLSDKRYEVSEINAEAATRGREHFHTVGCAACHSPRDDAGNELLKESSVPLGNIANKYDRDGLVEFLKDPLEVRAGGRMPKMNLTHWEAIDLSHYLLSGRDEEAVRQPFAVDNTLAAKGKLRFTELNCRQCHQVDATIPTPQSLPLSKLRANGGCLSEDRGKWPTFDLTATQRDALNTALQRASKELTQHEQIAVGLSGLRCLNCHQRDELGGVAPERDAYFHTANPNLGPQGRIPPTLTGVGAKLNADWMRQVLVTGRTSRPYVLTRMPQYGTENVESFVNLLQQADDLPPVTIPSFSDQKEMRKTGAEMVGTGGLNCIACHTFQLQQAANMQGVDLTEMSERLQKDWFYHYMRDPQSLSHNTIMPSFWPGGRAMRRDILDGNADLQVEALWQYLLDGRQASTPRGLIQEPMELLATDTAVMLRRSYPGIGKRGIGVGYPSQINLAFDAEQMRLAMIWQGKFADPGGVWRSQGHGRVRPLGEKPVEFAPGPDLDDPEHPWTVDDGRPPQHRFRGYSLDEKMRPRFRYQFGEIAVEDDTTDITSTGTDPSTSRPFLRRTVTLKSSSPGGPLAFRAATGTTIESTEDGTFLVDDRLQIRIDARHRGVIVETPQGKQLRIPIERFDGQQTLTLEYHW